MKLGGERLSCSVVIPCYRVRKQVLQVISAIPRSVDHIFCIDDACPEQSGKLIEEKVSDPRVRVIYHENNLGVGGAVKTGYLAARDAGCDIAVKVDGDGQMDPRLIPHFVHAIENGLCDYAKGNRFFRIEDVRQMPSVRLFGNAVLSFLAKASSGYWNLFDPTNGYTALHLSTLQLIDLDKVANRYFFETDLLFRLNLARCVVRDIPMRAVYGDEKSSLKISRILGSFAWGHLRNAFKRIFYTYFLRDFHAASLMILLGPPALLVGILFAAYHWWSAVQLGVTATPGTVMIGALLILAGAQLSLSALSFDMSNIPREPVFPTLIDDKETPE